MDKKTIVILIGMMIVDSYQRLKDPYKLIVDSYQRLKDPYINGAKPDCYAKKWQVTR